MHLGQRHQMLRRKGKLTTEPPKRVASRLDALVYMVALTSMFFTLDQVRLIWVDHNAAGVSMVTWAFYTVSACVWFGYGRIHNDKVLMLTNGLWVIINGTVALGVMVYA